MRLYVLTRSAYAAAAWDLDANRRRLALTAGVTVAGMRAQQHREWEWVVLLDRTDPLAEERQQAYRQAGVPCTFLWQDPGGVARSQAAMLAYRAGWSAATGPHRHPTLTLRLDDDDTLHPTTLARLWTTAQAARVPGRVAWMFPVGIRVYGSMYAPVRHESNAMHTLQVPGGDQGTVYEYLHRQVARHVPVRMVDNRPAWLWLRHQDTLSGHKTAYQPITQQLRRQWPVNWRLLRTLPGGARTVGKVRFK